VSGPYDMSGLVFDFVHSKHSDALAISRRKLREKIRVKMPKRRELGFVSLA
jgi:hypothetical protein